MVRMVSALVACFGNLLRGDDGFGPAVAERLLEQGTPPGVRVVDVGIGGIHLVHELLTPVNTLIVVDAVNRGRSPGTVMVIRPDVIDVRSLSQTEQRDQLADMHYATPERALMLAGALGLLPADTWLVGCEPLDADRVGEGLSMPVSMALDAAAVEIHRVLAETERTIG
jgi:hydrogenase maturation protease